MFSTFSLSTFPIRKVAYEVQAISETALARAVHLFTLGAYCWEAKNERNNGYNQRNKTWKDKGGGGTGSIFFSIPIDTCNPPCAKLWVGEVLLANPSRLLNNVYYEEEDCALILLHRLATKGIGRDGSFVSQDMSVRSGASWLCSYASRHSPDAQQLLQKIEADCVRKQGSPYGPGAGAADEMERKRREARERALGMMKAKAAAFAARISTEEEEDDLSEGENVLQLKRKGSFRQGESLILEEDELSNAAAVPQKDEDMKSYALTQQKSRAVSSSFDYDMPVGLLKERPKCIICSDDASGEVDELDQDLDDGQSLKSTMQKRVNRTLAFCGLCQASTVLKGPGDRQVGVHIALCGHAVHSSCCEAYLLTVANTETSLERSEGFSGRKGDEFRCPMCQRLSNCLVPFIDVDADWITPAPPQTSGPVRPHDLCKDVSLRHSRNLVALDCFISSSQWTSPRDTTIWWDGRCSFVSTEETLSDSDNDHQSFGIRDARVELSPTRSTSLRFRGALRNSMARCSIGRKDLLSAWNIFMRTPRFRRKNRRDASSALVNTIKPTCSQSSSNIFGFEQQGVSISGAGAVNVWRRLMDDVGLVAFNADVKRLGGRDQMRRPCDFGEFRHFLLEKAVYAGDGDARSGPSCTSRSDNVSRKFAMHL